MVSGKANGCYKFAKFVCDVSAEKEEEEEEHEEGEIKHAPI